MIRVKVPATTANLGPGFDCMGMALKIYNYIELEPIDKGLEINIKGITDETIPKDENNLVFISMKKVFDRLNYHPEGLRINLTNNIPLARGLGSSAACIVGGMLAANYLADNSLSIKQVIEMATELEGHPDNVVPAIIGGMTVCSLNDKIIEYVKINLPQELKLCVMVPDFKLSTKQAREVLPQKLSREDAVFNIGRASMLVACMAAGKFDLMWNSMQDRVHQPYRKKLIPGMDEIFDAAKRAGAHGMFISGAGPTLIAIISGDDESFKEQMESVVSSLREDWTVNIVDPCSQGAKVELIH